jgi:biopolymer transport protein ExbD
MAKSGDDEIYDINLVPFIDVVLVLLICFMIVAPVAYQSGIRVSLPNAKSGTKLEKTTLRFVMDSGGGIALDGKSVDSARLREAVAKALSVDPGAEAVVAADSALSHGDVMNLIDQLRQAGLKSVAMGVTPKSK